MDIVKILIFCLIAAVPIVLLRQYKAEYAIVLATAAGAVLLLNLIKSILPAAERLYALLESGNATHTAFKTAVKALGIAYLTGFVADTCRDFGQSALAAKAELAGRCAVFILAVPLLSSILQFAAGVADL